MGVLLLLITTICAATSCYRLDCTNALFELAPCLDYVTDAADCPSSDCCKQFANVIKTQPLCLCAVFDGTASKLLGVPIDTDRAIILPEVCQAREAKASQAAPTFQLLSPKSAAVRNQLKRNATGVHPLMRTPPALMPQTAAPPFTGIP